MSTLVLMVVLAGVPLADDVVTQADSPDGKVSGVLEQTDTLVDGALQAPRSTVEQLLGEEAYHYHSKMIFKDARTGGAWAWHQDYGYWYNNGCLFPHMASCLMAVDQATKVNGCLQVLAGSHHMGRINHGPVGDQNGADLERVNAALDRLERVYVELEPGDAVFFHSNLLHRSDQNKSEHPRWAFIACYNAARNNPYKESRHPRYSRLDIWEDELVLQVARQHWENLNKTVSQSS